MPAKRVLKRVSESVAEYDDAVAEKALENAVASRTDSDLYVVDRDGSRNMRRKLNKAANNSSLVSLFGGGSDEGEKVVSKVEQKIVNKIRNKQASIVQKINDFVVGNDKKKCVGLSDLWADEAEEVIKVKATLNSKYSANNKIQRRSTSIPSSDIRKSNVPLSGLSYNPSPEDHMNAIAAASVVTIKKFKEDEKNIKKRDIQNILTSHDTTNDIAKILINGSSKNENIEKSDDDDDDDDEEEEEEDDLSFTSGSIVNRLSRKERNRKTRAQLNKQRKLKKEEFLLQQQKEREKMERAVNNMPTLLKQYTKKLENNAKEKIAIKHLKEETAAFNNVIDYHEAGNVPLSDELNGSLRKIKPKGVVIKNQIHKMITSGDVMSRDRRIRHHHEKPHGEKRQVWIPKYKYTSTSK